MYMTDYQSLQCLHQLTTGTAHSGPGSQRYVRDT